MLQMVYIFQTELVLIFVYFISWNRINAKTETDDQPNLVANYFHLDPKVDEVNVSFKSIPTLQQLNERFNV